MSSHRVESIVFPAILTSSAVFSLLTLPFFFYRAQPQALTHPIFSTPVFQTILANQSRDLTIRYIGGSLVTSVVAGIATVELCRRSRNRQAVNQVTSSTANLQLSSLPHAAESQEFDQEDSIWNMEWLETGAFPDGSVDQAFTPQQTWGSNLGNGMHPLEYLDPTDADQGTDLALGTIMEVSENYSTCRIWVDHLHRRLFAIQVSGQYYSLFRLLPTKEAALEASQQLSQQQHRIIITPEEQQYAVWVWQPEAEVELTSV